MWSFFSDKSKIIKNESIIKKVVGNIIKTNMLTYCLKCKRNTKNTDLKEGKN